MLGSWCLAGVLGLAGVLVSCWGLFVLLGSWCGPGGLATITPPTTFVIDFRAVISMYLGGVISGPKDGVISDRNLRTRRQNELRQNGVFNLTVAAAGPRVATRIRRSNRKRMLRAATARVRPDLNSRTGWRHSFAEGGDFVPLPPGVPNSLSIRSPCTVFSTKTSLLRAPGGVRSQYPLRQSPKTLSFSQCAFRPLKNITLLQSEIRKAR